MSTHRYLIALGSNQRHPRYGTPRAILAAAVSELGREGIVVEAIAPPIRSRPIGPSQGEYANGAAVISTALDPPALLECLQAVECRFGRKRQGMRWRSRTLDLDVVLWSGGCWADERLTVPHPLFRERSFVIGPAAAVAGQWRDPLSGFTLNQLRYRLAKGLTRRLPPPR